MTRSRAQAISSITMTKGTPKSIHLPKSTFRPISAMALRAMALGGVPMGVPMPPMLAATGMQSAKAARPRSSGANRESTGARMASIIAAVAVLLMNMENRAVTTMRPSKTLAGLVPKGLMSQRARLISKRYLVAAAARKKPPRKRMMMGSAKVAMAFLAWMTFTMGIFLSCSRVASDSKALQVASSLAYLSASLSRAAVSIAFTFDCRPMAAACRVACCSGAALATSSTT